MTGPTDGQLHNALELAKRALEARLKSPQIVIDDPSIGSQYRRVVEELFPPTAEALLEARSVIMELMKDKNYSPEGSAYTRRMTWFPLPRIDWRRQRNIYDIAPETMPLYLKEEAEVIRRNVTWLLEHLYEPDEEVGAIIDKTLVRRRGMAHEPINWGGLSTRVEQRGLTWFVTLEEAAPGCCPGLCAYIERWLAAWGWGGVLVQTQWSYSLECS